MIVRIQLRILFLVFSLLIPTATFAQIPIAEEPAADTENEFFNIKELVPQLEQHRRSLHELRATLETNNEERYFEQQISQVAEQVERVFFKAEMLFRQDVNRLSFQEVKSVERTLIFGEDPITDLLKEVSDKVVHYQDIRASLQRRSKRWLNTREHVRDQELSVQIKESISSLLQNYSEVDAQLQQLIAFLIDQQSVLSGQHLAWDKARGNLRGILNVLRTKLFYRDQLAMSTPEFWERVSVQARQLPQYLPDFRDLEVLDYMEQNEKKVLIHFILVCVFGWLIMSLHRASFVKDIFPPLARVPVELLIIVALLLARWVYLDAPPGLLIFIDVLLIFPVMIFFLQIFRRYSGLIIGLGIFYVFDHVRELTPQQGAFNQLIFFIELIGAAVFSHHLHRQCQQIEEAEHAAGRHRRFLHLISLYAYFSAFLFLLLAGPLFFGYLRLALYIGEGLLESIYSALLFFVVFRLLTGFFGALLMTPVAQSAIVVQQHGTGIHFRWNQLCGLVLIAAWAQHVLKEGGVYEGVKNFFHSMLNGGVTVGTFELTTRGVLSALVVVFIGFWISRAFRTTLRSDVYERYNWDQGLQSTVDTVVTYLSVIVIITVALSMIGLSFQNFALIAGALSLGAGIGLQNLVSNFASGMVLLAERPVKVGDMIVVNNSFGNVTRIGMRSSTVKTLDHAELIIPNSTLVSEQVVNWTHSSPRGRISLNVILPFEVDAIEVIELLENTLENEDYILSFPAPSVLLKEFGESGLVFEVRAWIRDIKQRPELLSSLAIVVFKTLKDASLNIPVPRRDIRIQQIIPVSGTPLTVSTQNSDEEPSNDEK